MESVVPACSTRAAFRTALLLICWAGSLAGGEVWTLDRAVEFARTNSPDAKLAAYRINAAAALVEQANAAFWPRLSVGSSYTGSDQPGTVFGMVINQRELDLATLDFNRPPAADNLNVHGLVTVPLYQGGRNQAGRDAARAGQAAARLAADAVRDRLEFEVARGWFAALKAMELVRAAEAARDSLAENVLIVRRRVEGGSALKTEQLELEVQLARAREDVVQAANARALALRSLETLLGLERETFEMARVWPVLDPPDPVRPFARAELLAADRRIAAAASRVQGAAAGHLPRVDAFGRYDYDRGWEFGGSGESWTAGVRLQWDLWDGRLTRARVSEAEAELAAAREERTRLRLGIEWEIDEAELALAAARERMGVTEQAVAQAEEHAALIRARFEQGLALSAQVIDAETALLEARVRRAVAGADRQTAIAALCRAVGLPLSESSEEQTE